MRYIFTALLFYSFLFSFDSASFKQTLKQDMSPQKLHDISKYLVGSKYTISPLGEAKGKDSDPTFRLDRFDCTTFVETSMALNMSTAVKQAKDILNLIRYDGDISFQNRRHLPVVLWTKGLIRDGFLKDITNHFKGFKTIYKQFDPSLLEDELKSVKIPKQKYSLNYLPLDKFIKHIKDIPSGTIINVVRKNRANKPIVVTHQMIYFKEKNKSFFRHASSYPKAEVVDENIKKSIDRFKRFKWPVVGFNLLLMRLP